MTGRFVPDVWLPAAVRNTDYDRLERLLKLRDLLGDVFEDAWLHLEDERMGRAQSRIRAVNAAITAAVLS